ncbi:MAG: hypothetical protein U5Q03_01550 [Bacteroidota bacterium]|nr:hypothetical protein [Bacteroidota bacterium]
MKKVIEANNDDKIARRELSSILDHQKQLLNHYVWQDMLGNDNSVSWYFNGHEISLNSSRQLNQQLSEICKQIYHDTPRFRNELINKSRLSGTISSARKKIV